MTGTTVVPPGAQSPPAPVVTDRNRFYWDALREHRIELLRCQSCRHFVHYPKPMCDVCQSQDLAPEPISGRGTVYAWCTINQASHPYFVDKLPYMICVVEIEEESGIKIPAAVTGAVEGEIRCGMAVEPVFVDVSPTLTLPFFRPVKGAGT